MTVQIRHECIERTLMDVHFRKNANERLALNIFKRIMKGLRDEEPYHLSTAITAKEQWKGCVHFENTADGIVQVDGTRMYPHNMVINIWRWPDVQGMDDMESILGCEHAFSKGRKGRKKMEFVCVNPYHYRRVSRPATPEGAKGGHHPGNPLNEEKNNSVIQELKEMKVELMDKIDKSKQELMDKIDKSKQELMDKDGQEQMERDKKEQELREKREKSLKMKLELMERLNQMEQEQMGKIDKMKQEVKENVDKIKQELDLMDISDEVDMLKLESQN